jgi:hypothetical protein
MAVGLLTDPVFLSTAPLPIAGFIFQNWTVRREKNVTEYVLTEPCRFGVRIGTWDEHRLGWPRTWSRLLVSA